MLYFPFQHKEMRGFTDSDTLKLPRDWVHQKWRPSPHNQQENLPVRTRLGVIWYYRRIPFVSPLWWKKLEMCLKWSSSNAAWHTVLFKLPLGRWELSMQQLLGKYWNHSPSTPKCWGTWRCWTQTMHLRFLQRQGGWCFVLWVKWRQAYRNHEDRHR